MPELPEVEVLRRELEPVLLEKKICRVHLWDPRLRLPREEIESKTVAALERLGKYLLLALREGGFLVFHLGMTGQFEVTREDFPRRHKRVSLMLSSGEYLLFLDPRKFGKAFFLENRKILEEELGIDPLSRDFTFENFTALLRGKRRLKDFLLDQRKIAGIGNIYASEILFRARLHPERSLSSLTQEEKERLFFSILGVLEEAIAAKGTTIRDFRRPSKETGNFQDFLLVYGREHCPNCGGSIIRKTIGSRNTYFCPRCQG
ncbi:MAG: DNA-formamidopyrimidine glycosylase [Candidatus Caldatribacterium sp.]|nr:DNA-formamidopyrimidine glycosylase [Candidatus Caldatribacterium sp.]